MSNRGRPVKYETPQQMQKLIDKYFKQMEEENRPYTITGLALSLGMTRTGLIDYEKKNEDFANTIKIAKARVEQYVEEHTYMGKINSAAGIFSLKNFGWSDKQEIEASVDAEVRVTLEGELTEWAR